MDSGDDPLRRRTASLKPDPLDRCVACSKKPSLARRRPGRDYRVTPSDIISEHRTTSCWIARATSSESAVGKMPGCEIVDEYNDIAPRQPALCRSRVSLRRDARRKTATAGYKQERRKWPGATRPIRAEKRLQRLPPCRQVVVGDDTRRELPKHQAQPDGNDERTKPRHAGPPRSFPINDEFTIAVVAPSSKPARDP